MFLNTSNTYRKYRYASVSKIKGIECVHCWRKKKKKIQRFALEFFLIYKLLSNVSSCFILIINLVILNFSLAWVTFHWRLICLSLLDVNHRKLCSMKLSGRQFIAKASINEENTSVFLNSMAWSSFHGSSWASFDFTFFWAWN